MSGIKNKNTKPERIIRSELHKRGYRFRLHDKNLPGKPDIILPKYNAVIFIHGCFWHGHHCHLFKWPTTRPEFWQTKIQRNIEKDKQVLTELSKLNWRHLVIWECALKGKSKKPLEMVANMTDNWIMSNNKKNEIMGNKHDNGFF